MAISPQEKLQARDRRDVVAPQRSHSNIWRGGRFHFQHPLNGGGMRPSPGASTFAIGMHADGADDGG